MPIASKQSYYNSLGISGRQTRQILTNTALGICFFLNLVDSAKSNVPTITITLNGFRPHKINVDNDINLIDKKDEKQAMDLGYASQHGKIDEVKKLIKDVSDVNVANKKGLTPLHIASQGGHLEIVKALIDAGAGVNRKSIDGEVPLRYAAERGHLEIVKALIENGADVMVSNNNGSTSLHVAAEGGHLEIVKALIKAGADVNRKSIDGEVPLRFASQNGYTEVVKELIKARADVGASNNNGSTSLHIAATNGKLEIVKALIDAGDDVNRQAIDGEVALRYAAERGHLEIVKALIDAGADVMVSNNNGSTSLHVAAERGHLEIVKALIKALIEAGANVNASNNYGSTSLHVAADRGHLEIVKALIEAGAKSDLVNKSGLNAIERARKSNATIIVDYLLTQKNDSLTQKNDSNLDSLNNNEPSKCPAEINNTDYTLALTVTSSAMLGVAGVFLFQLYHEKKLISKASHILDSINLYLNKLPLFTLEEIKPLEWKIDNHKLVLELEHQPEDLKKEIKKIFEEKFSEDTKITEENKKSIITLDNPPPEDLLQNIKNELELLSLEKNLEFEDKYGEFFKKLDRIKKDKVRRILEHHFTHANDDNFEKLMHANLLNCFGFLLTHSNLLGNLLIENSPSGKISFHQDFYDMGSDEIKTKYNERTEEDKVAEPRDSIHNGVRIGERLVEDGKYFVRFSENTKGSDALACKWVNREFKFFRAETNDKFEIKNLIEIDRDNAMRLFDRIREPEPVLGGRGVQAINLQNTAQNPVQNPGQQVI